MQSKMGVVSRPEPRLRVPDNSRMTGGFSYGGGGGGGALGPTVL